MNRFKIIMPPNNPALKPWFDPTDTAEIPQVRILIIGDNPDEHRDFRLALANESHPSETYTSEEPAFQGSDNTVPSKPRYRQEHALGETEAVDEVKRSVAAGDPFQVAFVGTG